MNTRTRYDTSEVPAAERFAYWRESVCDCYVQLGCEADNRERFRGKIDITRHSILSMSSVEGLGLTVQRRKRDISASTDEYFLLSLQLNESSQVTQFGKHATLQPGDMALYASSEPYTLNLADHYSQAVVQLPAAKLIERLPNAYMLTAHTISGQSGIGRLVRQNILAFSEHINSPDPVLHTLVQETLIDMIATGLASSGANKVELQCPEQQMLLQAKSFIRTNLGNPELDRRRVAIEMGLTVRQLNAIFIKHGESISTFIRRVRLETVAADLRDVRFAHQTISEIAFRYGFSNMQHFSTIFRTAFGHSPRAYRSMLDR